MKLLGQHALVTGSSKGIGKAIALRLSEAGADITINYRSDERSATDVANQIKEMGRRAVVVQADVSNPTQAEALINSATEQLGPINILVNNVGEFFFKRLGEMDSQEWHNILESNLSSVFYLCRAVIRQMHKQKFGKIINIGLSPTYIVRGAPNVAAYAIAKTGVQILTRSLATEEAPNGITVNCVSPGLIDNGYLPPEQKVWMQKRVPAGKLGQPEEIAEAVLFLISENASYISGANLTVSGAWDWDDRPINSDSDVAGLFGGGNRDER